MSRLDADPGDRHHDDESEPRGGKIKAALLVIAVAGLGGGSWWAYRTELPRQAPENVPVIHSDAAPVKTAPADPGGMVVPDQDSVLLNRQGRGESAGRNPPKVEELLPDPEPILPRPVAPPKPVAVSPPPPAPSPMSALQAGATPVPQSPASPPPAAPQVAAVPSPSPVAPPAPSAAAAPTLAPSGKAYRLQLGALKTEDAAKQEWSRLQKAQPDVLGKLALGVSRIELGEKGTYYRIQAGPIADATQATQACATLKSRNVGCILVKP